MSGDNLNTRERIKVAITVNLILLTLFLVVSGLSWLAE